MMKSKFSISKLANNSKLKLIPLPLHQIALRMRTHPNLRKF